MNGLFKDIGEFTKDPNTKSFLDSQKILFNTPTMVYLTLPKKRLVYSILDLGAIEMSILLAAKLMELIHSLLMSLLNILI